MKRFLTICIGLGIVVLLFGALGCAGQSKPELGEVSVGFEAPLYNHGINTCP